MLAAVGIGTYMSALDGSVVNTILPLITADFRTDVATIEWVVTTYFLVVSALLLTVGRLGDLSGNKTTYVSGFLVFVFGSALCGLSASPLLLTPVARRPGRGRRHAVRQLARRSSPGTSRPLTRPGPRPAGNHDLPRPYHGTVPGGLARGQVRLAQRLLHQHSRRPDRYSARHHRDSPRRPFRKDRTIRCARRFAVRRPDLVALLFALDQGHNFGWGSPFILGAFLASVALLFLFVKIESSTPAPMLDLRLFSERVFSISTISAVLNYVCVSSVLFLMPFYLIQARGFSAAHTGLILISQPIVMAITAPLSGTLSDRIGSRLLTTIGMLVFAVGLLLLEPPLYRCAHRPGRVGSCGLRLWHRPLRFTEQQRPYGCCTAYQAGDRGWRSCAGTQRRYGSGDRLRGRCLQLPPGASPAPGMRIRRRAIDASLIFACGVALIGAAVCFFRVDGNPTQGTQGNRAPTQGCSAAPCAADTALDDAPRARLRVSRGED